MRLYNRKEECAGCSACQSICPTDAIRMKADLSGFSYPKINTIKCVECQKCQRVCPIEKNESSDNFDNKGNLHTDTNLYFGAQVLDYELRMDSSSGGMFSVFAELVLERGGYVCAAELCEDMVVRHQLISSREDLGRLRKTKYVQSDLGDCFRHIQDVLKTGENAVLFVGTPCQCQGLLNFLGRPYAQLYTLSLVCYGVPSPKAFKNYIDKLGRRHGASVTNFSFRDKRRHDNGHTVSYIADKEYTESLNTNEYNRLYFSNKILRPSCFECSFCTPDRNTDITIGDFWGIENVCPEFDDGDGNSMVIVHTGKGRSLWDCVTDKVKYFECKREDVLQPRLVGPTEKRKK